MATLDFPICLTGMFFKLGEAGVHGENVQTPHRKASGLETCATSDLTQKTRPNRK